MEKKYRAQINKLKKKSSKLFIRTYVCVKKNLVMKCNRKKKSNVFNWHEKKHAQKNCPTPPQKFNGPFLSIAWSWFCVAVYIAA